MMGAPVSSLSAQKIKNQDCPCQAKLPLIQINVGAGSGKARCAPSLRGAINASDYARISRQSKVQLDLVTAQPMIVSGGPD